MSHVKLVVVVGLVLASLAGGGCSGCNEEYYCDDTGCFWCDSYGCRPVEVPPRAECEHGDWECPADRPFCTDAGYCVAQCTTDGDCPVGLQCIDGVCLEPGTAVRPGMRPGYCGDGLCRADEYCAPSRCCLPTGGDACCADIDCAAGLICDTDEHACVTPPADAGTDDAGTDGGTDGPPPPPPQCRSNAECPDHYLCIDAVCKLPCHSSAECGLGCECVGGFCTSPDA
jgi:hypothetical protein